MNGFTRLASVALTSVVVAGSTLAVVPAAMAQGQAVRDVTAYFAAVDRDDAVIRAGGNDLMYPVMKLAKGAVLRVDGETADVQGRAWSRVSLPPGSHVLVPADAVSLDAGGKSGVLSKLAKVKLPNMSNARGSWQDATPVALASGAKVSIVGQEPETGAASSYRVTPPEQARAFVLSSQLRRATQAEIDGLMGRVGTSEASAGANVTTVPTAAPVATPAAPSATQTQPAPQAAAQAPAPAVAQPVSQPVAQPTTQPTTPPSGTNLAEPMVITQGGANPSMPPAAERPQAQPQTQPQTQPPTQPVTQPAGPVATPAAPAAAKEPGAKPAPKASANPYERLEAALADVRKQPAETAAFGELADQYAAEIAKLPETPGNKPTRARLQQRLDWLNIMRDLQAKRRANTENLSAITQGQSSVSTAMADLARNRQYTVVGRLTTSTLYDGTRLPRMYRVQAVSGGGPRTLAYVRPDAVAGLDGKIGQVVGIVGAQAIDANLNLNIITPSRVDVLEASAAQPASQPASQPGPTATPAGN